MATINAVIPPQETLDLAYVARLAALYAEDHYLPPIIVLDNGSQLIGITGSHRLAAIKAVAGEDAELRDLEDEVAVLDYQELWDEADKFEREALEALVSPSRGGDIGALIKDIVPLLSSRVDARAYEDQLV